MRELSALRKPKKYIRACMASMADIEDIQAAVPEW